MNGITKLQRKIGNRDGESIIEVLVSLLISVLSLAMLVTMVTTSTKITKASEDKMKEYYDASLAVTKMAVDSDTKTCTLILTNDRDETEKYTYRVNYCMNSKGNVPVVSYAVKDSEEEP